MLRYLALGDSYTIGEGVAPTQRWPAQLVRALRQDGIELAEPHYIATTGWTTGELASAIDAAQPLGRWEFVSLGIGVNDQYRGHSRSAYREGFEHLLATALHLTGREDRVLAVSIPDWGVTPFALRQGRDPDVVRREIDDFNDVARRHCEAHRVAFVDITPISRDRGGEADMLTDDGLHPSAAMYARWVDAILPVAHTLLAADA